MPKPIFVTVYPTKKSSLTLVHGTHGPLSPEGSTWPKDLFTNRRIADGSVTTTKPASTAATTTPTPTPAAPAPAPVAATAIVTPTPTTGTAPVVTPVPAPVIK